MGWETRQRGGRYYTRSRKVGGHMVREYIGGGIAGELAAELDELERMGRRFEAEHWREERARLDASERDLAAYCAAVGDLMREHLTTAGYHQHARGEWRRSRMTSKTQTPAKTPAKTPAAQRWQDLSYERQSKLVNAAQHGDMAAYRAVLDGMLEDEHLRESILDVEGYIRKQLIEATYGQNNLLMVHTLKVKADEQRAALEAGTKPSAMERLLIGRVVTCWLDAQLADLLATQVEQGGAALTKADYYGKRAARAQRRYLDATLALARVRRLLAPVVAQVNIAQAGAQQLNMASPAQPALPVTPATPASATRVAPGDQS